MLLGFLDRVIGEWRPRFCLIYLLWGQAVRNRANVGWDHWSSSHKGCNINQRQSRFRGKKNNRFIGKKPPSQAGIEEENQGRKDFVVIQSSRINLCGQWCVKLLHLQSTIAKSRLHLGDLTRLCSVKSSLPATTFFPYRKFS